MRIVNITHGSHYTLGGYAAATLLWAIGRRAAVFSVRANESQPVTPVKESPR